MWGDKREEEAPVRYAVTAFFGGAIEHKLIGDSMTPRFELYINLSPTYCECSNKSAWRLQRTEVVSLTVRISGNDQNPGVSIAMTSLELR